jgi:glyoxylase-like metal-dependent hydrolase (beta-lactamase superfamily II)
VPKGQWLKSPMGAFLLEHPTAGQILVDTGVHPSTAERLNENFGRLNGYVFRTLRTSPEQSVPAQLRGRDIDPDQIPIVLMTHLHVDHASAMSEFPGAKFICAEVEWRAANARLGAFSGYTRTQLPPARRVQTIDFDDAAAESHPPFDHTVDLFGDGSVRLLFTPGHTRGHVSVLVRLADREGLLIGDAVYTMRNLLEGILPYKTVQNSAYRRSAEQLRAYFEQNPDALVIPTHDIEVWERLDEVY